MVSTSSLASLVGDGQSHFLITCYLYLVLGINVNQLPVLMNWEGIEALYGFAGYCACSEINTEDQFNLFCIDETYGSHNKRTFYEHNRKSL